MMDLIILFPLLGGLLGWLLFAVLEELFWRKVTAVFTFYYLIEKLKPKAGQMLEETVLNENGILVDIVEKVVTAEDSLKALQPSVAKEVAHFVDVKIDRRWPMISMLLNTKTKEKIKIELTDELMKSAPDALLRVTKAYLNKLREEHRLVEQLQQIPVERFSCILKPVLQPLIKKVYWLGAFAGALIGLVLGIVAWIF